jgi:hypothetical protein
MEVACCFFCSDNSSVDVTCHMCVSSFLVPYALIDLLCFLHGLILPLNVLQSVISYTLEDYQMIKHRV